MEIISELNEKGKATISIQQYQNLELMGFIKQPQLITMNRNDGNTQKYLSQLSFNAIIKLCMKTSMQLGRELGFTYEATTSKLIGDIFIGTDNLCPIFVSNENLSTIKKRGMFHTHNIGIFFGVDDTRIMIPTACSPPYKELKLGLTNESLIYTLNLEDLNDEMIKQLIELQEETMEYCINHFEELIFLRKDGTLTHTIKGMQYSIQGSKRLMEILRSITISDEIEFN